MKKMTFTLYPDQDPRVYLSPQPGSRFIPKWYRDGEKYVNKEDGSLDIPTPELRAPALKSCSPFLDSIISGFMQPLSCAIEITKNNGTDPIEFRYVEKDANGDYVQVEDLHIIDERQGAIGKTMPRPAGHSQNHMVWVGHYGWKVPRGWSVIVTHPMNQFQLPFTTSSGIMESDRFHMGGNIPWYIKEGFTGVIEKGTPIFQLIPIKRAKWLGILPIKTESKVGMFMAKEARAVPEGFYRDKLWVKKEYDMEK